ncbi:MAG: hypothetical protein WC375_00230 [Methanomassiliicoccales archaeon]
MMYSSFGIDFWSVHSGLFLISMLFFPRLTLLFATAWGGGWWWIGWFFAPRFMAALLATVFYWDTNPELVIVSWLAAIAGNGISANATHNAMNKR